MPLVLRYLSILVGLGLIGLLLWNADLATVLAHLRLLGWQGALAVLAIYFVAFLLDTVVWMSTLVARPPSLHWLYQLWKIRLVGEAVNSATPLGSVGGEPVKAYLLRRHFGISLREGASSLVLAKTAILVGLVLFLSAGFGLMLTSADLPHSMKVIAGFGLGAFGLAIAALVLVQRFRLISRASNRFGRGREGERLKRVLDAVQDVDERFVAFYRQHRYRFVPAVVCSMLNWMFGALELMVLMIFLGRPISIDDAVAVEALAQLVRAGTFFIPMSLGAQDGTFMLALGAITGMPEIGLAVAVVRRGRELAWVLFGALMYWTFSGQAVEDGAPNRP